MSMRKILVILLILVCATSVSAQIDVIPVDVGENVTGEVNAVTPVASFSIDVRTPQTLEIQVLTIGSGLTPAFRVLDPSGLVLQSVDNSAGRSTLSSVVSLSTPGTYRIDISGTFGTSGQFLLSLQEGEPLEAPEPILPGEAITGRVDNAQTRQAYIVAGSANGYQLLTAESRSRDTSPVFVLRDSETNELMGTAGALIGGARFRLPPGEASYLLEVLFGGQPADFFVCLESEQGTIRCPGSTAGGLQPTLIVATPISALPTPTLFVPTQFAPTQIPFPTINPAGACLAATAGGTPVNVRSGPSTSFGVITQLSPLATALVVGRLPDSSWYQVTINGATGWVSGQVVRVGGNCSTILIIVPPTATPISTLAGSFTPTNTPTLGATATPTNTPTPVIVPTLNFSLPPNFGSTALTSGFVPDPFSVGVTSGGSVNVNYLGGGCTGFATSAPDFSVNYTAGAFPTLRFYFVGSGDATLIINSPSGSYFCNDDSFGTLNPAIDFNSPSSGRYDIWVGSFASGTAIGGTLFVTENTGNHP